MNWFCQISGNSFFLTKEWFSWVKRPFFLSSPRLDARATPSINQQQRESACLARGVIFLSLPQRIILSDNCHPEAWQRNIFSGNCLRSPVVRTEIVLWGRIRLQCLRRLWESVNVIIGRMVKCRNWTDGQMSESDPEAIRGIRASPSAPPHIGPKLLQPWRWWQIGTDQVLLGGKVLNRGLQAF